MTRSRTGGYRIAYGCLLVRLGDTLALSLNSTPFNRLLESNICRNYYRLQDPSVIGPDDNVPEQLCKIAGVQTELAHINGLAIVFSLLPTVLAALPYLSRNQVTSKTRTLFVNVLGSTLMYIWFISVLYFYNTFSPRWIWLIGMFSFFGGGDLVFNGLLRSCTAESIEHGDLSSFLIYTSALGLAIRVIGSAVSLLVMNSAPYAPVLASVVVKALGIPIVLIFLRNLSGQESLTGLQRPLLSSEAADPSAVEGGYAAGETEKQQSVWDSLSQQYVTFLKYLFPMAIFALEGIGDSIRMIFPYWFSTRFHWSLREVGWVQLGTSLLTAVVVSLVPRLGRYLQQLHQNMSSKQRDLLLSKICLGFYAIGVVFLGLSWERISGITSFLVMSAGVAFRDSYTSCITADMEREDIPQVYVVIQMVLFAAASVGGWAISDFYGFCLTIENPWATSLPIWACVVPIFICWYYIR